MLESEAGMTCQRQASDKKLDWTKGRHNAMRGICPQDIVGARNEGPVAVPAFSGVFDKIPPCLKTKS